ncbi:MAG: DUF4159 domain-containing protein [Candidatus Tokpelaia sp.]|nr:MAG: DUF4159 domain-containing protein [Candidatus Tokpelaia sp.]KAA6206532.1 MAG: DUF4159 domain-containing protein [Candidatus Tokpelaia sp.]
MNGFSFAASYILWALLALPALWWLLRLTPPRPQVEIFPPLRLLRGLQGAETQALRCPWWLIMLRLGLAALLILAFARPVQNRGLSFAVNGGPVIIMLDNGFAAYPHKDRVRAEAQKLLAAAAATNSLVYIIPTAGAMGAEIGPYSSIEAKSVIDRLSYSAIAVRRDRAFARLAEIVAQNPGGAGLHSAYLTDGLAAAGDKKAFALLSNLPVAELLWYQPQVDLIGITAAENGADGLHFTVIRAADKQEASGRLAAYDEKAQIVAEQDFHFAAGAETAQGLFALPAEIRNDIAWLQLLPAGQNGRSSLRNAAGLRLLDTGKKQKTVAILAPAQSRLAQPLLSPLYYVAKALEKAPQVAGGKVLQADSGSFEQNIDMLLKARPALLIMGDIAAIPAPAQQKLRRFVEKGGTLLRFAGPALANADNSKAGSGPAAAAAAAESLLPVPLRRGERSFGGALSWEKPQKLAPFPPDSPFYGQALPQDVLVFRQILAEPSADLFDKSWVALTDGTPLVSSAALGRGRLVFVHTGLDSGWSNLALSGFFVDMLQKLVAISGSSGRVMRRQGDSVLAPYRIITAEGVLAAAPDYIRALKLQEAKAEAPDFYHPPGFYGTRNALYPLNLLGDKSRFAALPLPLLPAVKPMSYAGPETNWQNRLLIAAFCLFIMDIILSLLKTGNIGWRIFRPGRRSKAVGAGWQAGLRRKMGDWRGKSRLKAPGSSKLLFIGLFFGLTAAFAGIIAAPVPAQPAAAKTAQIIAPKAQNSAEQEDRISDKAPSAVLAGKTRLAYVLTGKAELDAVSKAGLQNLSRFIERRTTIEPGNIVGIDPARDELAFYPLIYWPIDAQTPMPARQAIDNMDSYMRRGGTILFDTRDALQTGLQLDGAGANTSRLRAILAGLNVPPLIPAPPEHVIARSFYIMPDFPGHYRNSPLWIAAGADSAATNGKTPLIRAGDGVSPILITANDFAGAWADDGKGGFLFPLVPDGEEQRLWAFRGGLNIVMYILTGNYKADQMHMPELLRRLSP